MFNACKTLFKGGANASEVAEYMKIGRTTAGIIRKAEDYEEYRAMMYEQSGSRIRQVAAIKAKEAEKKEADKPPEPVTQIVEHRQTVTVQATHYMMEEMKKTNEMLTLISNKLAFIVDELCGVKTNAKQDH